MLKPRSTATRELVNLDGLWRFALDTTVGDDPVDRDARHRAGGAVPASYNDLFVDAAIRDHVGWVWYQRTVRVPRGWAGERVVRARRRRDPRGPGLRRRRLVAEHVGGYTPFEADITEHVRPGEEFRLTVGVNNELTNVTIPPGTVTVDAGRPQEADVPARLLQLRGPRPLGVAVQRAGSADRRHHGRHRRRRCRRASCDYASSRPATADVARADLDAAGTAVAAARRRDAASCASTT